jgi:glutathione peroxidase
MNLLIAVMMSAAVMADPAKPEAPKQDAPKQEAPKPDAPKSDAPKSDQPAVQPAGTPEKAPEKKDAAPASPYVLGYTLKDIDGKDVDLSQYKGKVVLFVNVASKCGYTPQYAGLEKLYKEKMGKGFVVLGFPANNFGEQEPGSDAEIKSFCSSKYNVTFPMFAKISVRGEDAHPMYKQIAAQAKPIGGDPQWNFTKYLVDKDGNVVAKFDPKVKPDDATMNRRIDELLGS